MTTTTGTTFDVGQTYHLPPETLRLERNIRDAKPDADLVDSIKAIGVLEPIVAVRDADGQLLIRSGHRRALAAIEADTATVPVYVAGDDDQAAEVDRIIWQRDENTHRAGLTTAEEVGVVAQLAAFGLSAEEISKQARIGKDRVATALQVTGSKVARKAAAKWDELTLDQVAAIAEFEDDQDAITDLVGAAREGEGEFAHVAQQLRDAREEAARKAECVAKMSEVDGLTVVEEPHYGSSIRRLDYLVDDKGKILTPKLHKSCPGNVSWAARRYEHTVGGYVFEPEYGCQDWSKHGHRDRYGSTPKLKANEMSDAERAKAKESRRLVVENNRAWASAEAVRREWLAVFAKLKTPPKGAAAFIAIANSRDSSQFDYHLAKPRDLAAEWLGIKMDGYRADLTKAVESASEARALVIALVYNLAIYEAQLSQQSWRVDGTTSAAGRYLRFLEACGYTLSDVEKFAISKKTA